MYKRIIPLLAVLAAIAFAAFPSFAAAGVVRSDAAGNQGDCGEKGVAHGGAPSRFAKARAAPGDAARTVRRAQRTELNPADPNAHGSGSVDHIAFAATDYDELVQKFTRHGVPYRSTQVPGRPLRQLFVHDPDGIQIEINIRS
jgi:catechol 2,3-dioxygenase-like lactoylglutathione lyase family enzyme